MNAFVYELKALLKPIVRQPMAMAVLGAVIGYGFGIAQSFLSAEQTRVETAQMQYNNYLGGSASKAKSAVDEFWQKDEIVHLKNLPESQKETEVQELVIIYNVEDPLQDVLSYYKSVVLCAGREACDLETTCVLFHEDMKSFVTNYRKYLGDWKPEQAEDLVPLVGQFLKLSCGEYLES